MKIQLKTVFGELIFEGDFSSIAEAVKAALAAKKSLSYANLSYANLSYADLSYADLSSANLSSANLSSADLRSADLRSANLSYANLSYADLSYADLSSANLSSANLSSADLRSADLRSANLSYANLSSADLRSADLRYADLRYADLSYADLSVIKHDVWAILAYAKSEVPALRKALAEGKVNGSAYRGECACLVGTIANARKVDVGILVGGLAPDSNRPAERFFLGIKQGDTPETNQCSKIALGWVDEWISLVGAPKPATKRKTAKAPAAK